MAKLNLRTGTLSGKLGNMIYNSWRGIPYTRSRPKPNPNYQPTPAQQTQRQKFALAARFTSTLAPLLNLAFFTSDPSKTGKSSAISHICKHAVTGVAPLLELDYPRIRISQGLLPGTPEASATANVGGQVQFRWINTGDKGYASNSDKALLAIYCPALQQSVYNTAAADRREETATLDASAFSGHTAHSWLGFLSEDRKLAADSVYTGTFIIS
jgi:hypothetical protein